MKMNKKLEYHLRHAHIDFTAFRIIEILPQNNEHAVVLLAPKDAAPLNYFAYQHEDKCLYYNSIEDMLLSCVRRNYLTRRAADKIIKNFYKKKGTN